MNIFQAKELFYLLTERKYATFFIKLYEYGVTSYIFAQFQKEFKEGTFKYDPNFYERLYLALREEAPYEFTSKNTTIDIFFSFSSKNMGEAQVAVNKLRSAGFSVFFSGEDLGLAIGTTYYDKIEEALEQATHFVLYFTEEAKTSNWVRSEYVAFLQHVHLHNPQERRFFIVYESHINHQDLPILLRSHQTCKTEDIIAFLKQPEFEVEEQARLKKEQEEAERQARLKKEQEEAERQARLRTEQEEAERQARLRTEQEEAERQARLGTEQEEAEKQVRLKKEQEEAERQARLKKEQEEAEKQTRLKKEQEETERQAKLKKEQEEGKKEEALWQSAKDGNVIKLYQNYLERYRQGKYAKDAKEKIRNLQDEEESIWQNAKNNNQMGLYYFYLNQYKQGIYVNEAKERIEVLEQSLLAEEQRRLEKEQEEAEKQTKLKTEKEEAERKARLDKEREEAKKEESSWQSAKEGNSVRLYQDYLIRYNKGKYAEDAKEKIRSLQEEASWKEAVRIDTIASYKNYLANYPNGKYAKHANTHIENFSKNVVWQFESGAVYSGEVKNNKFNGQGKYVFSNGQSYVGQFRDGVIEGYGSIFSKEYGGKLLYKGYWVNGKKVEAEYADDREWVKIQHESNEEAKKKLIEHYLKVNPKSKNALKYTKYENLSSLFGILGVFILFFILIPSYLSQLFIFTFISYIIILPCIFVGSIFSYLQDIHKNGKYYTETEFGSVFLGVTFFHSLVVLPIGYFCSYPNPFLFFGFPLLFGVFHFFYSIHRILIYILLILQMGLSAYYISQNFYDEGNKIEEKSKTNESETDGEKPKEEAKPKEDAKPDTLRK